MWEEEEKSTKLMITQMTVADNIKLANIHDGILKNDKITEDQRNPLFLTSRVACSIKTMKGDYFFTQQLEEINELLSGDVIQQLYSEVMKLNPVSTESIKDAKK